MSWDWVGAQPGALGPVWLRRPAVGLTGACLRPGPIPSSRWGSTVFGQWACGSDVCARRGEDAGASAQSGRAGSPRDPAVWKWVHIPAGLSVGLFGDSRGSCGGKPGFGSFSPGPCLTPRSPPGLGRHPSLKLQRPVLSEYSLKHSARSHPQAHVPASPGWARTPGGTAVSLLEFPTLAKLRIVQDAVD